MKFATAANVLICSFHQSGHCRYGSHCNKSHTQDTCTSFPCMKEDCHKRHPKLCRYFIVSGFCKFHEKCSYLHITRNLDLKSQLETEVENLKQEIQSLFNHVSELRGIVSSLSSSSTASSIVQSSLNPVASQSTTSSALINALSTPVSFPNSSSQSEDSIPQLDGGFCPPCSDVTYKCETCEKIFVNEDEFRIHDSFKFCCDECFICFPTQMAADLHELEVHPELFYSMTYIPESTKSMFANNKPLSNNQF